MTLYRLVLKGDEFERYETHWLNHGQLPSGVTSVVIGDDGYPSEFVVPVVPDIAAVMQAIRDGAELPLHEAAQLAVDAALKEGT